MTRGENGQQHPNWAGWLAGKQAIGVLLSGPKWLQSSPQAVALRIGGPGAASASPQGGVGIGAQLLTGTKVPTCTFSMVDGDGIRVGRKWSQVSKKSLNPYQLQPLAYGLWMSLLPLIPKKGETSLPCWEGHVCSAGELTAVTKTFSQKPQDRED